MNPSCITKSPKAILIAGISFLALVFATVPACPSLLFAGVDATVHGIGTSNFVLTLQNAPSEQGCVAWNGLTDLFGTSACQTIPPPANRYVGGNEMRQTQTLALAGAGVTNADHLRVILNVTGPAGTLFTIQNLTLTIYDNVTGAILFSSGNLSGGTFTLTSLPPGQGAFAFRLDPVQVAEANPFISCPTCAANRIGLAASLTGLQGGIATFSISGQGQ